LGITLGLEKGELVLRDLATGAALLTRAEAAEARAAELESARRAAESACQAAEQRAAALEAEIKRLRRRKEKPGGK
jgi:hypothetical protein